MVDADLSIAIDRLRSKSLQGFWSDHSQNIRFSDRFTTDLHPLQYRLLPRPPTQEIVQRRIGKVASGQLRIKDFDFVLLPSIVHSFRRFGMEYLDTVLLSGERIVLPECRFAIVGDTSPDSHGVVFTAAAIPLPV